MSTEFYKVKNLKGTKKLNGKFVDLPFCPCCNQYVNSLVSHLQECGAAANAAKKYGSGQ